MRKFGVLTLLVLSGCSGGEPVEQADVYSMMLRQVQPEAEAYWQAVQYISDESGLRRIEPKNDAEWSRVAEAARNLRSLGEAMKAPAYARGKGSDWLDFSQGLIDVSGPAEEAANARNLEQVLAVGGTIYNVCTACHEVYMPNPPIMAPSERVLDELGG